LVGASDCIAYNDSIAVTEFVDECDMTTMTIRNLPDAVQRRLRVRAAKHGRSMEAEVRQIIADAVADDQPADWSTALESLRDKIRAFHGGQMPTGVVDDFIAERREEARRELEEEG